MAIQAGTYLCWLPSSSNFFLAFSGFIDRNAEECDRKQGREVSDTQQGDPRRESNPGPLQSPGTWVAHATNRAKRRPSSNFFTTNGGVHHFVDAVEISYPKNYPFHGTKYLTNRMENYSKKIFFEYDHIKLCDG